jgi:hypothetical protein
MRRVDEDPNLNFARVFPVHLKRDKHMTRNQKIALGCGGAGCLGLIVVMIVAGLAAYFYNRDVLSARRSEEWNFNSNRSSNLNSNDNDNENSSSNSSSSTAADSLSEDEKHKLYYAANATGDIELIRRVNVKLGLMDEDFTPGEKYQDFAREHISWAGRNYEWVLSVNTPEKARAYVNEHLP